MPPKNSITFEIEGLDELEARLKDLPDKLQKRVIRPAIKKAMEPVLEEAKRLAAKAPEPTHPEYGHLVDNLHIGTRIATGGEARSFVGTGDAFWGLFLEYGEGPLRAPMPFLRPALEKKAEEVLDILAAELTAGIEKVA